MTDAPGWAYPERDAVGLAELVRGGEASPRELIEAAIDAIERLDPHLNAVITRTFEEALARVDGGLPSGPFRGVPFLLKDIGPWYAGAPHTAGSRSRTGFVPAEHSELVRRYLAAGLVVVGKTNVPELGLQPTTEPELHGPTRNPWNLARSAGGSSGGSAAAVAARIVPAAHGNDGGGSIRIPASACGLFGLKPSRGRTPQDPSVGESWFGLSSDHVLTRSVRDSAALLDAVVGPAPGEPYTAPPAERPFVEEAGADPGVLRIAFTARPLLGDRMDPEPRRAVEEAASLCAELGHRVEEAAPPIDQSSLRAAFVRLAAAETAFQIDEGEALTERKATPREYELATWFLGLAGRHLGADELAAAWAAMRRAGLAMARFHDRYDILLTPTLARPPWPLGDLDPTTFERGLLHTVTRLPARPVVRRLLDELANRVLEPIPNTPLFNLTGQPAASLPLAWTDDGLPVGVQVAARYGGEANLFRLAAQLEVARPWEDRRPPVALGESEAPPPKDFAVSRERRPLGARA